LQAEGLVVTAFNFLAHKIDDGGPKPKKCGTTIKIPRLRLASAQGKAMVLVTGQTRHMWGSDAFSVSVYGQVSSGVMYQYSAILLCL
jgi:hypothetical protein